MEFVLIFGIGIFLLGIAYVVSTVLQRRRHETFGDWPTAPGTVRKAYLYPHERRTTTRTSRTFTPIVEYAYEVEGVAYTSKQRSFAPDEHATYPDRAAAEAVLAQYPPGSTVTVHYNPQGPAQAALEVEKPVGYGRELNAGLINLALGVLTVLVYVLFR